MLDKEDRRLIAEIKESSIAERLAMLAMLSCEKDSGRKFMGLASHCLTRDFNNAVECLCEAKKIAPKYGDIYDVAIGLLQETNRRICQAGMELYQ